MSVANARVVHNVQTSQLISRHTSENQARPRILSVLARQLERFREQIPAFAAQRNAVHAYLSAKQRAVAEKVKEVERCQEQKLLVERSHVQQYELLVHGLQRQAEESSLAAEDMRRQLGASFQEESDLSRQIAGQEEQNKGLRAALDKTLSQMEGVQQSVLQIEVKGQNAFDLDEKDLPELAKMYQQMDSSSREQTQVREQMRLTRVQMREDEEALEEQRAYARRLEEFIRRISGGGGRYVLPAPMKREASRLLNVASKLRASAARAAAEREAVWGYEAPTRRS